MLSKCYIFIMFPSVHFQEWYNVGLLYWFLHTCWHHECGGLENPSTMISDDMIFMLHNGKEKSEFALRPTYHIHQSFDSLLKFYVWCPSMPAFNLGGLQPAQEKGGTKVYIKCSQMTKHFDDTIEISSSGLINAQKKKFLFVLWYVRIYKDKVDHEDRPE